MSIKQAQFIHSAQGFVIDRIQTGGVSNMNIPKEQINELGNNLSIQTLYDIPDLSFDIEDLDMSTRLECLLLHLDPTTTTNGTQLDFQKALPLDVISPFLASRTSTSTAAGVAVPYLNLESATYRFGVKQDATQTFSLRGDAVYYIPGSPRWQQFNLTSGANQQYTFTNTALGYTEAGVTFHALSVCVKNVSSQLWKRLFIASDGTSATGDYTDTNGHVTLFADWVTAGYTTVEVTYGTATVDTYGPSSHTAITVVPGALRAKDIHVSVWTNAATPVKIPWGGVQSAEASWKVTLDPDEELGNARYVTQDYDIPDVSGSLVVKPVDFTDLLTKIGQITATGTGTTAPTVISGPLTTVPVQVDIKAVNPDTGATMKTVYIPDARFTIPALQGRVKTKTTVTFPFSSDSGLLYVYKGNRPGS